MGEVFETSDMEAAERVLSDAYGSMRISARGPRRGMRLARTLLTQAASLDHLTFTMSFDATAARPARWSSVSSSPGWPATGQTAATAAAAPATST